MPSKWDLAAGLANMGGDGGTSNEQLPSNTPATPSIQQQGVQWEMT